VVQMSGVTSIAWRPLSELRSPKVQAALKNAGLSRPTSTWHQGTTMGDDSAETEAPAQTNPVRALLQVWDKLHAPYLGSRRSLRASRRRFRIWALRSIASLV
jgi:hypothetical protein